MVVAIEGAQRESYSCPIKTWRDPSWERGRNSQFDAGQMEVEKSDSLVDEIAGVCVRADHLGSSRARRSQNIAALYHASHVHGLSIKVEGWWLTGRTPLLMGICIAGEKTLQLR